VRSKEEAQFGKSTGMVKNSSELATRLGHRDSGVEVKVNEFDGQTHGTAIPECLMDGLQFALQVSPATSGK
jgi:hypothetical protein